MDSISAGRVGGKMLGGVLSSREPAHFKHGERKMRGKMPGSERV